MPDCTCGRGPWITLSQIGVGKFDLDTDQLVTVVCPSRFCLVWAPLVDGKIGRHAGAVAGVAEGDCPWIGIRVVDDRADVSGRRSGILERGTVRREGY
ncbi:hypothetical protein AB0B25_00415 [Nocardia sp. NPDC049190]|uniref:hypothetical protein n=1 Tax=Nocardia sp. NPDC049190 TaxID=3155650 RepID=UPI0033E711FA